MIPPSRRDDEEFKSTMRDDAGEVESGVFRGPEIQSSIYGFEFLLYADRSFSKGLIQCW